MCQLNCFSRGRPVLAALALAILSCTYGGAGSGTDASPGSASTPTTTAVELPAGSDANAIAFYNGMVITMDDSAPQAQAVLISGDRIIAVGSDDEILAMIAPDGNHVDLQGRTMTPGFIDAHQHRIGDYQAGGQFTSEDAIIDAAIQHGWTGLDEMNLAQDRLEAIRQIDREGRLRVRVAAYLGANTNQGELRGDWYEAYQPNTVYSPNLKIAGLKFFDDIAWGTVIFWDPDDLNLRILQAHQEGWQIAIHTVGTNSHSMVLHAFEQAAQGQSLAARRHRVEHVFGISDSQIEQMQRLGLIGSVQLNVPTVLMGDNKLIPFYQREPPGAVARWRDLIDSGLVVAGSSDWPVGIDDTSAGTGVDLPMRLIYLAVARPGLNGALALPWMADQAITVDEAMHLLTINAAYSTFDEAARGSITPGKLADLVILSDNPLEVQADQLSEIEVWMTMVGGNVEWCAPGHEALCPVTETFAASTLTTVEPPPAVPTTASLPTETPLPASAGEVAIPAGQPIQIAVLGPGSGDNETFLYPMKLAVRLGVADYGLVQKFSVHLVGFDDACDEAQGRAAAEQITANQELVGVIGSLCSAPLRGGLPLFEQAGIVVISPGATGSVLPSFGPSVFNRVVLNDDQMATTGRQVTDIDALPTTQEFYRSDAQRVGNHPRSSACTWPMAMTRCSFC